VLIRSRLNFFPRPLHARTPVLSCRYGEDRNADDAGLRGSFGPRLLLVDCGLSGRKPLGPDYVKLKALLPPGPDAVLCFARTYDGEHLRERPQQRVTELILFIRYITLGEERRTWWRPTTAAR
jgi:hypothetical protein